MNRFNSSNYDSINKKKRKQWMKKNLLGNVAIVCHGKVSHPMSEMKNCRICQHINNEFNKSSYAAKLFQKKIVTSAN